MNTFLLVLQVIVALGIVNVWLLRFGKSTAWRGGEATSLREEFRAYGLPVWFMYTVGGLKLGCATLLIAGLWIPELTTLGAVGLMALMTGAVAMHVKIGDPLRKSLPAISMLVMSTVIALLA